MPRKRKVTDSALAPVPSEILDHFAPDRILSAAEVEAAAKRFKKALIERALRAELTHHLGYAPGGSKADMRNPHEAAITLCGGGSSFLDRERHIPRLCAQCEEGTQQQID